MIGFVDPDEDTGLEIILDHSSLEIPVDVLQEKLQHAAHSEGFAIGSVNVILSHKAAVHRLNREFLGHDYPTDVVSFPLNDSPDEPLEGEIHVDLDTALERAEEFDATFEREAMRYAIHGFLHLMGYNDTTAEERAVMRELEDRYLG